jgi:NAD(P)-dependent dehydrogenase (short-subunit alcohol dehydrogenase family)
MKTLSSRHPQKRVLITGGASGIGQALALRFAAANWRVAIADIHLQRMQETAEQIKKLGGEPLTIELNVASEDDWAKARGTIKGTWGGIDLLFNNAGIAGTSGSFEEHGISEWQRTTDINYWSVIYGCDAFLPLMKPQGSGHIINTASAAGVLAAGEMGAYNATKAAVVAMSETLHKELGSKGISVSVICPTVVKTNINESKVGGSATADAILGQVESSSFTADDAAEVILKGMEKRRLYIFTRYDGYLMWLFKRVMPQFCSSLIGWMQHRRVWLFK